jgi:Transposase domain (DUF772)
VPALPLVLLCYVGQGPVGNLGSARNGNSGRPRAGPGVLVTGAAEHPNLREVTSASHHTEQYSDVEVADRCRYNPLYRAFIGLPLGGPTPDDATLVVFRRG